ncbi:flagellar biosynthetic protein FliR [Paenibacillus thermotolerans]|uniref:flagellar biosynthetic protein FliR n=1 Tax=Paenibacillus thermotolerans TaxID=3027807 RepID=UPI002368D148|nr:MULTISPECIES: flagellar biosynthetic protein FliR [unclassified Paenibacillus]
MELALSFLPNLLLIFCRLTGFFVTAPVFSSRNNVPMQFRIGLSVFISLLVFLSAGTQTPIPMDSDYALYVIRESLIGVLLGFIAYMFFTVVQIAGSFIDMQMGFGIANVIDPMTGAQTPVFGSFKYIVGTLIFFSINGHHYLLAAILDSYQAIPLENRFFEIYASGTVTELLVKSLVVGFTIAFQMAAPIVASMFLIDVALGILTKTSPQFNIFVVGMPLKIIAGLFLTFLLVPTFLTIFQHLFGTMFDHLFELLRLLRS